MVKLGCGPRVTEEGRRLKLGPGHVLDGRFVLGDEIGRGGMANIFRAEDLQNERRVVAVKVPLALFASGVGAWSMFQREEEIGRRLDHPYLLKFVPLEPDKRRSYMVTEYVPGRTLTEHLRETRPIPEREALALASKICDAVDYLHRQGIVHYDLKPSNVIECPDGSIRLIDFGLAHRAVTGRFDLSAAPVVASADCAAPEQIRRRGGRKSVDIYAVGAMLYEMLTGQTPFPGDDPFTVTSARLIGDPPAPRALNPLVSLEVEEIVLRALRRNPSERYATAALMKADLDHPERVVVSGIRNRLRPVTPWKRRLRWARHAALVALLPLALQVGLFVLLWWQFAAHKR
jgi:serine/threonine-protein kinase